MVFSSLLFVFLFLALNLVSQAALRGARQKNIAMLLFSLVFFSWAGPRYVVLLLLDTALCWFFAICIEREPQRKKLHLSLCVALVLLVLGIFKYTGFLMGNLQSLFGWPEVIPQIVLPIGISFYTFQLISYVVDVYRGEVRAQKKYWILLLYASLFHQCIAGPIVRYRDVAQDLAKRQVHAEEVSRGISRFTVGLAKKAVLANSVAVLADRWLPMTTEGLAKIPTAGLWLGGLCYMLQIYLDFSAYSDMAIGMGLMCGFHYKENFNYPYIASSVTDFWRRWHISLSTFFRDYVYIPLGGNRRGKGRQLLNLFIVWGLTGLWHGASWNYVLWGLYFFLFLVIEKFLLGEKQQRIPAVLRHLFLLIIVYFCWVIFRFRDAAALGMAHTSFANPNGLDAEGHYSTARDMAALAAAAMDDPTFRRLCSSRCVTIGSRTMENHNRLLRQVEGCVGLKTGYTKAAGRTLVSCAERNGCRLIVVTLRDGDDWADHAALYEYGFRLTAPRMAVQRVLERMCRATAAVWNGAIRQEGGGA